MQSFFVEIVVLSSEMRAAILLCLKIPNVRDQLTPTSWCWGPVPRTRSDGVRSLVLPAVWSRRLQIGRLVGRESCVNN